MTREGRPRIWDFGSAAKHHDLFNPWLHETHMEADADPHAHVEAAIAELALRLRDAAVERVAGMEPVRVGLGVHTGSAVCALIDAGRVSFGLWGDAPDTARELAWRCPTGEVLTSPAAHAALHGTFAFEARGFLETAAGSQMRVFSLVGRRAAGVQR